MRLSHFVVTTAVALLATGANPATADNSDEIPATTTRTRPFSFDYGHEDDRSGLAAVKEERLVAVTAAAAAGGRSNGGSTTTATTSDEPGFWKKVKLWWKRRFGNQAEDSPTATRRLRVASSLQA